jgi:hypothetical protein
MIDTPSDTFNCDVIAATPLLKAEAHITTPQLFCQDASSFSEMLITGRRKGPTSI